MLKTSGSDSGAAAAPAARPALSEPRRGGAARPVGSFVARLTRPAFEKFGFSAAALITDWAHIVGADLARATQPERLRWPRTVADRSAATDDGEGSRTGATLHIRVDQGRALDIQYRSRQIVERINAYFGYRAVAELRLLQAPIAAPSPTASIARARPQPEPIEPPPAVAAVSDPALRDALLRMAAGIKGRRASIRNAQTSEPAPGPGDRSHRVRLHPHADLP